jgi:hypothetical protein
VLEGFVARGMTQREIVGVLTPVRKYTRIGGDKAVHLRR